jgi:cob(I)alamin adenosyltransferase
MSVKIYTRSGDEGDTGLFGGQRVRKDDLRVEAYGTVDELNAAIGVARTYGENSAVNAEVDQLLADLQNELFLVGADLATPGDTEMQKGRSIIVRTDAQRVSRLEALIDRYEEALPPLTNFILPGGHPLAAQLHWCRTVCRRAERRCVTLQQAAGNHVVNAEVVRYLNRLSDLLFVLARFANHSNGVDDVPWRRG